MRLSSLHESLTTAAIADRPYALMAPKRKKSYETSTLKLTDRQYESDGPQPSAPRKPQHKTYLMRRKRVYTE